MSRCSISEVNPPSDTDVSTEPVTPAETLTLAPLDMTRASFATELVSDIDKNSLAPGESTSFTLQTTDTHERGGEAYATSTFGRCRDRPSRAGNV